MKSVKIVNAAGNTAGNSANRFIAVGRVGRDVIVLTPHGEAGADYDTAWSAAHAFASHWGLKKVQLPEIPPAR